MFVKRPESILLYLASALVATATVLGFTTAIKAQTGSSANAETIIPLEGLDPVMLTQGKEVQGDMKFKVTRGQFQYIFARAENQSVFEKDPARYEIQLDGHCARMGAPVVGNPDLYAVHNGLIYIFGTPTCKTLFVSAPEKYLEVPTAPKAVASAEALRRGQMLVAKAVEAMGGASKVDQIRSFQEKDTRGNGNVKNYLQLAFPDRLRQETVRPNFTLVTVITPSDSFLIIGDAAATMPQANRNATQNEVKRKLIVLLRARTRPDFIVSSIGPAKAGETAVEQVDIEFDAFNTVLGIDPAGGRVLSQSYRGRGPGGVVGQIVIHYSDFRTVEGLSLPFKTNATFNGEPFPDLSTTTETITINSQIDPATFQKPKPAGGM